MKTLFTESTAYNWNTKKYRAFFF